MDTISADIFGARLIDERKRLGLTQAELATRIRVSCNEQKLRENGACDLGADYLAQLHLIGIDIIYVLTGVRHRPTELPTAATDLLRICAGLPATIRESLLGLAVELGRHVGGSSARNP
jgi:transcriptional regulator with XRE-family HTH domain